MGGNGLGNRSLSDVRKIVRRMNRVIRKLEEKMSERRWTTDDVTRLLRKLRNRLVKDVIGVDSDIDDLIESLDKDDE